MNKFHRHIKSLPESGPSFQKPAIEQTVITHSEGVTRGVTRMAYPQLQQIPRNSVDLSALHGLNVRHIDINLADDVFIQSHS